MPTPPCWPLAGLKRLGLVAAATAMLDLDAFLPAVGQGAIGIETRADDGKTRALVDTINDADTATALAAERAFLAVLDGSCRTPIAGHARVIDGVVRFRGLIAKPTAAKRWRFRARAAAPMRRRLAPMPAASLKRAPVADFFKRD